MKFVIDLALFILAIAVICLNVSGPLKYVLLALFIANCIRCHFNGIALGEMPVYISDVPDLSIGEKV